MQNNLSKKEMITLSKLCEKLYCSIPTPFLDRRERKLLEPLLRKRGISYQVYEFYKGCDKVILYQGMLPKVHCFKIISKHPVTHQDVLGSLFALSIKKEVFGDIVFRECPYILVLDSIMPYIKENFIMIRNEYILLEEVPLETIQDYEMQYETIHCNVASTRIDAVLSKLTSLKRSTVQEHIRKKEVILNDYPLTNKSYILKENDVFSIRKYGKYKFHKVIYTTKKNRMVVEIKKYQ